MSKWIDAEWIRNVYADFEHYDNRNDWTTPIANVLAVIDDAPSIDIVRCKECTERDDDWCMYFGKVINPDDFCSYGEREEKCKECWYWSEVHKRCENKCGCQFKPYGERKESE